MRVTLFGFQNVYERLGRAKGFDHPGAGGARLVFVLERPGQRRHLRLVHRTDPGRSPSGLFQKQQGDVIEDAPFANPAIRIKYESVGVARIVDGRTIRHLTEELAVDVD
ncbi:MAG: hypothetical protein RIC93_12780, partial [Alphaproteobacteria bacterium]